MDLEIAAPDDTQASTADAAALAEVERLRKILGGYGPASEISRLNMAMEPMACSLDLIAVLFAYDQWQEKSGVPPAVAAVLMMVISGTGLLLWMFVPK